MSGRAVPALVIFPEFEEDIGPAFIRAGAAIDDAYWLRFVNTWQDWSGFLKWWIARRWIMPTDPRNWEFLA